jgi:hypothetical protein
MTFLLQVRQQGQHQKVVTIPKSSDIKIGDFVIIKKAIIQEEGHPNEYCKTTSKNRI